MNEANQNRSIKIFDDQFRQQIAAQDFELNPFETVALDYLKGTVLDLACGLGNLSLEAGRRGHEVMAVDSSPVAVAHIQEAAQRDGLPVKALQANLETWEGDQTYETIIAIGALTYFRRERALQLLRFVMEHVNPGGRLVINALIEGTTYFGLFDSDNYCLFAPDEIECALSGWSILSSVYQTFDAPDDSLKMFTTVIADRTAH